MQRVQRVSDVDLILGRVMSVPTPAELTKMEVVT
jgi:hypothetical protein